MQSNYIVETYRCAIYLRLSKEDQGIVARAKQQSNSIENQREYIEEFLKSRENIQVVEIYVDDGYSGVNFERPAFQRMLQDIRDKKIDCVIVKDLSRLGRNYIEVGKYIERLFPFLGVRFIAINDNYDSADETASSNNIIIPFKNLINDAYCRDISIKIRSHLEIKRKRGEFIGAFAVYGYMRGADKNRLEIDSYAAEIVKEIFQMKLDGMSQQGIADELNQTGILSPAEYKKEQGSGYKASFQKNSRAIWTAMAIHRILSNEVYTGTLVQGKESTPNYKVKVREKKPKEEWIKVSDAHEAIIKQSEFDVVQEIMERDTRVSDGRKAVSLYSGYLTCADCGCSMVRKKASCNSMQYIYYVCSGNKKNKEQCSSHRISENELNEAVKRTIQTHIRYLNDLQECIKASREAMGNAGKVKLIALQSQKSEAELEKNKHLKIECYEDYKQGLITQEEYLIFKNELDSRIEKAEGALQTLDQKHRLLTNTARKEKTWIETFIENQNTEISRAKIVQLIHRIYVSENHRIEIVFRYQDELEQISNSMQEPDSMEVM